MNPVLATVVPVCVALPALPHNHPLVPQLYPTQRLHSPGALSSSWLFFLLSPPHPQLFQHLMAAEPPQEGVWVAPAITLEPP